MSRPFARRAAVRLATGIVLLSACRTSGDPRQFAPATSPNGVTGTVHVAGGGDVVGELLAVTDTAYLMLVGSRLMVAPYAVLTHANFGWVGRVTSSVGELPSDKTRRRLVLYSRFPYGLSDSAMAGLLAKSGQTAPDNARTAR